MLVPAVSVIISNFNGANYLPRLLDSLRAQQRVRVEIIVVDRNSRDESDAILAASPEVCVVKEPPETGLVTGYAVGAEFASHDLLFFCNEDMWFDPNCLALLAEQIDLSRRIGAADPWQWNYSGENWIHGGVRLRKARFDRRVPYPFRTYDFSCELSKGTIIPFPCAGAVMIHREVYRSIGGWDRSFFLDHEDVDLFIRAWQRDWHTVTVPDAKVYHAVNASNAKEFHGTGVKVSRRRYISGLSSIPTLGLKYFTGFALLLPIFVWFSIFLGHLVRFDSRTKWDLLAIKEFLQRSQTAIRFRRSNSHWNRRSPGQHFFRDHRFQ
jgi:GT2 family glycosyltransferase